MQFRKGVLVLAAMSACSTSEPVTWSGIVFSGAPQTPYEYPRPAQSIPNAPGACPGSMRLTHAGIDYAVWWESQSDSSVTLKSARGIGGHWEKPVDADTTDHGVRGCARPAPAVAADSASGYVHIAYFSEPTDAAGIFFAHSMDSAKTFHSPVPIVFGRNPSRVSVASSGDRVVVAYEDPNSRQPLVGIALSKTMGHIFESRSMASSENGHARQPVVRLAGDSVRLWWSEYSANPTVSATRPMYRAGLWR